VSPTTKARYGLSAEDSWRTRVAQFPPIHDGTRTVWPRLEIGKSSVTPWSSPITMACKKFMWYTDWCMTGPSPVAAIDSAILTVDDLLVTIQNLRHPQT
jgi:hypothetical protein